MRFADTPIRWRDGHAYVSVEHDGKIVDVLDMPVDDIHAIALLRHRKGDFSARILAHLRAYADEHPAMIYTGRWRDLYHTRDRLLSGFYSRRRKNPA